MGSKKEEATRIITELKGIVEHRLPYSNANDSIPDLINLLDDLKDTIDEMDLCQCTSEE